MFIQRFMRFWGRAFVPKVIMVLMLGVIVTGLVFLIVVPACAADLQHIKSHQVIPARDVEQSHSWLDDIWFHMEVFVRCADGQSICRRWNINGEWSGWLSDLGAPPGGAQSAPEAVSWAPGRIDVFVLCGTSPTNLCHTWYDFNAGGWQYVWEDLGNPGLPLVYAPGAASISEGSLHVFAVGENHHLYTIRYINGSPHRQGGTIWQRWDSRDVATSRVAVVSRRSTNQMEILWMDTNNNLRRLRWTVGTGGSMRYATPQAESLSTGAGAISFHEGLIDTFVMKPDGNLWHCALGTDGCDQWENVGGSTTYYEPAVISPATDRMDIFYLDTDNRLRFGVVLGGFLVLPWQPFGTEQFTSGPDLVTWTPSY